jgi:hypothetical protein
MATTGVNAIRFRLPEEVNARKVALAKFLKERTTVSLEWVVRALCMGGR